MTEEIYDIFYNEFKMLDKFNYIKNVFYSCKSDEQKEITYNWGMNVLWGYFDEITTKYQLGMKAWFDVYNRTFLLSNELKSITGH